MRLIDMPIRTLGLTGIALLLAGTILAACGTIATPAYKQAEQAHSESSAETTMQEPSATPVPPTATDVPPTATPLPPTETPTEIPTEVPTEAPTEASSASAAQADPLFVLVSIANPSRGEQLFVQQGCTACHNVASEETLVGPGLLNIINRAGTRVADQGAYTYMFHSIRYSQEFIVEGYPANVMPNYDGILSDADIYDLVAYLATLTN
jgi:cytochrome c2